MTHLKSIDVPDVDEGVDRLFVKMREGCGYLVDRNHPIKTVIDVFFVFFAVLFLFLFGKVPALVLSVYPAGALLEFLFGNDFK